MDPGRVKYESERVVSIEGGGLQKNFSQPTAESSKLESHSKLT